MDVQQTPGSIEVTPAGGSQDWFYFDKGGHKIYPFNRKPGSPMLIVINFLHPTYPN